MKPKFLILLTVFIDIIGVGVIIPILPFYVARFTNSPQLITSLFAVFSLCAFFSAPIIGALSDKYGRRPLLIASIFSTAIGWFVFAGAQSIGLLFVGRIIDGVMAGNFPIAQSYLSDISKNDKERTTNLGLIGAIFGVGLIVGPLLGGLLGQLGHTVPFWFVGILALFNAILAYFTLPETHTGNKAKVISINPFKPIVNAINDTKLKANYLAWALFGLAISGFQAIFALFIKDTYHYDEFIGSIIFGIIGVIIVINQGFAMKHFWLRHFKGPILELGILVMFGIGFLFLNIAYLPFFVVALILTTFGQSILRVVMTSQVVSFTEKTNRGEVLGIMSSITSLSMTLSPFIAGALYGFNRSLPFLVCACYLFIASWVLYNKRSLLANEKLEDTITMESQI